MVCRACFILVHAAKLFLTLTVVALLVPIAAQGTSSSMQTPSRCLPGLICIYSTGGATTGGVHGLTIDGSLGSTGSTVCDGKVGKFYQFKLIGPINGTWEGGTTVSGQTAQLSFHSESQYNGGLISLASGTAATATPEPGALGLTGMGLAGMGLLVRRKVQRDQ